MKLSFQIAWRFLKSSKGQSIMIAIGIAIGVSVQVFIGSLIQGLQKSLIDKTIGHSSHITVLPKGNTKAIENYQALEQEIKAVDSRIKKISSSTNGFAFLKKGDDSYSMQIMGFEIEAADKIYGIKDGIVGGTLPGGKGEIMIGKELSREASIGLGDTVKLVTASGSIKDYKISGIFDLKVASLNKSWVVMTREAAQELLGFGDKVTSIEMQLSSEEVFNADKVAAEMEKIVESRGNIKVDNWKAQNEQLLSGLNGQSASSGMIQVFVLISVVLGIASVLAISVVQKSRQIGILKAMGIKDRTASLIFIFEGLILGGAGAVLGVGLGFLLQLMFTRFAVNTDGTPVVPLYINYGFIALSAVIAVLASTAAAVLPARKSTKLSPIEVIKNG